MAIIQRIKSLFNQKNHSLNLTTDIHSHLLPSIDDGVKSLDESIEIIEKFITLGYKKLIITPHVMFDYYNNPTALILEKKNELENELLKRGLDIKIEVAAEYMLDEEFVKRLEGGDILSFGENYLLFETGYYQKPYNFEDIIFKIESKGFKPVLAHPERYRYMNEEDYRELKKSGVYFQCNINSFGGFYGKNVEKKVKFLAGEGMVDFLGSDCHSEKYINFMKEVLKSQNFHNLFVKCDIKNNSL
ncbi:tyrosine-protein phosphatase [Caminibacter sp.]